MPQNNLTFNFNSLYSGIFFGSLSYINAFCFSKTKLKKKKNQVSYKKDIFQKKILTCVLYNSKKQFFSTCKLLNVRTKSIYSNQKNLVKNTKVFKH